MVEEGIHDYAPAKKKAAARFGLRAGQQLPSNESIDLALGEYHRIYRADRQPMHLRQLRQLAVEAMRFLRDYSPRLVGGVLEGWAGEHTPITLHLFPPTREAVIMHLLEHRIPFQEKPVTVMIGEDRSVEHLAPCFMADDVEIRLILIADDSRPRLTPRTQATANLSALEALLSKADTADCG